MHARGTMPARHLTTLLPPSPTQQHANLTEETLTAHLCSQWPEISSSWKAHTMAYIGIQVRGMCGSAAPESGKAIIFRANAKFLGRSQQPKTENIFVFIKRKKQNSS